MKRFQAIRRSVVATALATVVVCPGEAWCQTEDDNAPPPSMAADPAPGDFDSILDTALSHYKARRFEEASGAFERAYALRKEPEIAYNIARSYERALRRDEAIAAYKHFLGLVGTTAELRTRALTSLRALEEERALEAAPPPRPPPPPPLAASTRDRVALTTQAPVPPPAPSRALEYGLIGAGAVAAIVGGVFAYRAFSAKSDLDSATMQLPADVARVDSLEGDVRRDALAADVMVGGGLLTAGIGVILLLATGS